MKATRIIYTMQAEVHKPREEGPGCYQHDELGVKVRFIIDDTHDAGAEMSAVAQKMSAVVNYLADHDVGPKCPKCTRPGCEACK